MIGRATLLSKQVGINLEAISEFLTHSDTLTTNIYVNTLMNSTLAHENLQKD